MGSEDLGLAQIDEKGGGVLYFKEFRLIMKGLYIGYIEFRRKNGKKVKASPDCIRRWPKGAKFTKEQEKIMEEVKQANIALKNTKKREKGDRNQ